MRISEKHRYDSTAARVEDAKSNHTDMMEMLTSQKRINRLSDDPVGVSTSVRTKSKIEDLRQAQKNIGFSKGYLEASEASLGAIHENLLRARDLAVMLSNGTYAESSREAGGREIREIIEEVVSLGNATYGRRYVFSGFRTLTPALGATGEFLGDDGAIMLQMGKGSATQINLLARDVFEATVEERERGHMNMVDTLSVFLEGLRTNQKDMIQKALSELDFQLDKASSARATIGARFNAIEQAGKQIEIEEELSVQNLSQIQDADFYRTTSDFKRTESTLQGTLMASNKILQPSLLNFMQ